MNQIDKKRSEIKSFFKKNNLVKDSHESFESPNGRYSIRTSNYLQDKQDVKWNITKVEVFDNQSKEKIFDFFSNDDQFFYQWLTKDKTEYLICAEDLFGGQTIIDLTNKIMESYSPDEDGFISTEFYLSPNTNTIAIVGCFWACPYIIKIYDFQKPLSLPLKELNEIDLLDNSESIIRWLDNENMITNKRNRITVIAN